MRESTTPFHGALLSVIRPSALAMCLGCLGLTTVAAQQAGAPSGSGPYPAIAESRAELPKFLYFARSDDRGEALAQAERLVETLRTKSPRGFRWYAAAFPDETHGSVALLAQIDALRRLYDGYRFHPDLAGKGIAFADEHFAAVSKRVGWALPVPETVINDLGYAALQAGKTGDAIALFERNVSENPNSANAFDSLADGYAAAEEWARAAAAEDRAVALAKEHGNPNLPYFIEQSRKLNDRLTQKPPDGR